jgi:hypothetical protein
MSLNAEVPSQISVIAVLFLLRGVKNKDQKANLQNLLEALGLPVQVALAQ